jgi:hypothetical protein
LAGLHARARHSLKVPGAVETVAVGVGSSRRQQRIDSAWVLAVVASVKGLISGCLHGRRLCTGVGLCFSGLREGRGTIRQGAVCFLLSRHPVAGLC